jgi:hypothetical protein
MKRCTLNGCIDAIVREAECDYNVVEYDCCVRCARILSIRRSHGGILRHVSSPELFLGWQTIRTLEACKARYVKAL